MPLTRKWTFPSRFSVSAGGKDGGSADGQAQCPAPLIRVESAHLLEGGGPFKTKAAPPMHLTCRPLKDRECSGLGAAVRWAEMSGD